MSTFNQSDRVTHPALVGVWTVSFDQLLPHRHINVVQGNNTAQVTADDAVLELS